MLVAPIAIVWIATYFGAMAGPVMPYVILAAAWLAGVAGAVWARWPRRWTVAAVLVFTLAYMPGLIFEALAAACFFHGDCL